ncbi:hypothetical protein KC19_VG081100 [Ceratodon purpureus]|uniref:Acidic leucine-rich nuclear phosphoprotein 32-related protein n=1 Tax=Ceratodon purpureus TaxID=3225 RepID=A0A8T0HNA5_CERPU|nr:hypothetical protein KC19_VG081100 [Ceratodon purpureus]
MEEGAWDRAVERAKGRESAGEVVALTLDGVVKCAQGKLPKAKVLSPFTQLKRLSIANVGLSSLADFPSLPLLERLTLSDNRIAGGLEHLVYAGLKSLRELDLSNNKIQVVEDLKPLAQLKLESLDLYECPLTRSADYRATVFGMMKSLRFLDKTDVVGNERPESDDDEEESEEEEDVDDFNGDGVEVEGEEEVEGGSKAAVEQEDDKEGEKDNERDNEGDDKDDFEDEEQDEGGSYQEEVMAAASVRGFAQGPMNNEHRSDEEDAEDEEDDNLDVQDVEGSEEADTIEEDDDDAAIGEEASSHTEPASGAPASIEVELDVLENEDEEVENRDPGEDDEHDDAVDDDEGDDEVEVEEDEEEEEEFGTKYLMQPIGQPEEDEGSSDFEPGDEVEDEDFDDEEGGDLVKEPVGLTQNRKRIREETGEKEDRSAKHQ